MRKIIKNILPIFIFCVVVLYSTSAHAFVGAILGAIADAALAVVEWTLRELGLIGGTCDAPTPKAAGSCLFCPLFKLLFNAGSMMAANSYAGFKSGLVNVLMVFLAVSLALIVLKNIASFGSKDPSGLVNEIVKKSALVCIIATIISVGYQHILSLTVAPIFDTALQFVNLSGVPNCSSNIVAGIKGFTGNPTVGFSGAGGIPLSVGESIVCSAAEMERKIHMLFEYGDWAFCRGIKTDGLFIFGLIPNPIYLIDGIILYVGGLLLLIGYPWVIADAILQLGIAMTLLPFAVCGFAFNGTKQYLSTLFKWTLNSMFALLFMGILITCIVGYIEDVLNNAIQNSGPDIFVNPIRGLAFYGTNLMIIIFVLVIGWLYMPSVRDLANNFASGSNASATKDRMEAYARDNAEKLANNGAKKLGKAAVTGAKITARDTKMLARKGAMASVSKFGTTTIDAATGNKVSSVKIAFVTYSTETNSKGQKIMKKRRASLRHPGRIKETISDGLAIIENQYENGVLVKSEVKFKYDSLKKGLIDKKGNINVDAVQSIMNSNLAQTNPEYAKMMMAEVALTALEAKGIKVGKSFNSRNFNFDPNDPTQISFVQEDFSGKKTTVAFKYDPKTGRYAVGSEVTRISKTTGDVEQDTFFDNGMLSFTTKGSKDSFNMNKKGTFQYSFSDRAQAGHRHYTDDDDSKQIIDSHGNIAKDLDPSRGGKAENDLFMGFDEVMSVVNGGRATKDDVVEALKQGRIRKTGKVASDLFV